MHAITTPQANAKILSATRREVRSLISRGRVQPTLPGQLGCRAMIHRPDGDTEIVYLSTDAQAWIQIALRRAKDERRRCHRKISDPDLIWQDAVKILESF